MKDEDIIATDMKERRWQNDASKSLKVQGDGENHDWEAGEEC